ncbi:CHAT domain-containing protein [Dactylosporangium sp. NPDC049742]|uniref:CHAT domain-containing protein n=1 Tax=Dactylosporangium sp. NPDC049742 TaxID=3154737 RepID=UPI0034340306
MIEVSVTPGDVVAGRATPLSIRFANTGRGSCFNVVFKLRLPTGVVLMSGSGQVEIPAIRAGQTHTHTVTVAARRAGAFELTSTNFSYRDENDSPVRVNDFRAGLTATAAPAPERRRQPSGRLRVECEDRELDLGAWDELSVRVTNTTGVPLDDVIVDVVGPFSGDGKRSRIAVLADGATARCTFAVNAAQGGRHVPVTVSTTYGYRDLGGDLRTARQEDHATVVVRAVEPRQESPSVQTVLYLAASPRNLPQLRSDLEMRKVKERLQLSRHRDQYRIEPFLAARFDDISQALVDYEPQIVHFSGHGDSDGNLCVEDETGNSTKITPEGLAGLFGQHSSTIRCVVLNACYSQRLAEALTARIDHVVGMRYRIGDEAAIEFSVGFYLGLFAGWAVPDAFARGRTHLLARPALYREHDSPLLFPPA